MKVVDEQQEMSARDKIAKQIQEVYPWAQQICLVVVGNNGAEVILKNGGTIGDLLFVKHIMEKTIEKSVAQSLQDTGIRGIPSGEVN